jgi:hypothetical protein
MRIQYAHDMLERVKDAPSVRLEDMPLEDVPNHIQEIITNHEAFSESNTFGRPGLGTPEEYEKLVVSEGDRTKTFEYFNKGIHFMSAGTEEDRPVFQVFAHFMKQARSTHNKG